MNKTVTQDQLKKLRNLVDEVISSTSKSRGVDAVRRLEFSASMLRAEIDPYFAGKLSEVVTYAKSASGQSRDKEHWISCVEQCWYVFEYGISDHADASVQELTFNNLIGSNDQWNDW